MNEPHWIPAQLADLKTETVAPYYPGHSTLFRHEPRVGNVMIAPGVGRATFACPHEPLVLHVPAGYRVEVTKMTEAERANRGGEG